MLWMLGLFLLLEIFFVVSLWAKHKRIQLVYISYFHVNIYPLFSLSLPYPLSSSLLHLKWIILAFSWPQILLYSISLGHLNEWNLWNFLGSLPIRIQNTGGQNGFTYLCHVILSQCHDHNRMTNGKFPKDLVVTIAYLWHFFNLNSFSFMIFMNTQAGGFPKEIQF